MLNSIADKKDEIRRLLNENAAKGEELAKLFVKKGEMHRKKPGRSVVVV